MKCNGHLTFSVIDCLGAHFDATFYCMLGTILSFYVVCGSSIVTIMLQKINKQILSFQLDF